MLLGKLKKKEFQNSKKDSQNKVYTYRFLFLVCSMHTACLVLPKISRVAAQT